MVANEAECAVGKHAGTYVEVACVFGAETEGALGEAVLGDVGVGRGEDGFFGGGEGG